jgi:hypothetical protein
MSHETSLSIEKKIDNFNLEKFLLSYHFDYVFSDGSLKWLGSCITGVTLKHVITAIMLYKLATPLRYVATLTVTNLIIKLFKKRGMMPLRPPAGSSIPELIKEQQDVLKARIKRQKEAYKQLRSNERKYFQAKLAALKKARFRTNGGGGSKNF